jgi:hypothetical protein
MHHFLHDVTHPFLLYYHNIWHFAVQENHFLSWFHHVSFVPTKIACVFHIFVKRCDPFPIMKSNIIIHLVYPSVCDTTFCCKSIFYVSATESAIGKSIVVWNAWLACSLWSPFPICGDKQGRAGRPRQPLQRAGQGVISIKEILGENRGTCI